MEALRILFEVFEFLRNKNCQSLRESSRVAYGEFCGRFRFRQMSVLPMDSALEIPNGLAQLRRDLVAEVRAGF